MEVCRDATMWIRTQARFARVGSTGQAHRLPGPRNSAEAPPHSVLRLRTPTPYEYSLARRHRCAALPDFF